MMNLTKAFVCVGAGGLLGAAVLASVAIEEKSSRQRALNNEAREVLAIIEDRVQGMFKGYHETQNSFANIGKKQPLKSVPKEAVPGRLSFPHVLQF